MRTRSSFFLVLLGAALVAGCDPEPEATGTIPEQLESFFNYVVELQRRFGITMPAIWRRQEL